MLSPRSRNLAALALLVVSVAASVTTYLSYNRSQSALHAANAALLRARVLRKLTDYKLCGAINQGRAINNRDRETFIRSRGETKRALRTVKDPTLHALLAQSLKQSARELSVRPHLAKLPCTRLIEHPSAEGVPPAVTRPTTSTG